MSAAAAEIPEIPKDRRALVAVDLGAESCRVSLLRWQGESAKIELVHRFPNQAIERDGHLRWDLDGILRGLHEGFLKCAAIATEGVRSIAVDGWAVDYVRFDAAGAAMGDPFCYRDERTLAAETALHERISAQRMREITGVQLQRLNTVYQIFADAPALQGCRWLNLPEYVLFTLGGRAVSERTNATHTQMVELGGAWSEEIFAALGQSIALAPELVRPGADLGEVQGELAKLPAFAGARLIAPACHDTASAIAAIPDAGDDWAYISSGTWSLVGTVLHAPINSAAAQEENFTNLGGVDGTTCFHKNLNGMWLLRQCMETWESNGAKLSLAEMLDEAAAVVAPQYALDVDDADLLLPGDMPARINAQLRRRGLEPLSDSPKDAAVMVSFLLHSLARRYAQVLASIAAISGKRFRKVYVMGGGSQNELLNRLTAQATGLEVLRAGVECSTLGNFAVQLAALEPDGANELRRPVSAWAAKLRKSN